MSINTEMTSLADAIRTKSGTTGKLSISGMTDAVNSIVINTGGGDIDLSFVTASAEHILTGKVGADRNGNPVYGTLEVTGGSDIDLTGVTVTADTMLSGIVAVNASGEKVTGNIPTVVATLNDNIVTVPVGYIAEAQVIEVQGGTDTSSDTVTASVMLEGYTAHDKDGNAITGTIKTVVPTLADNVFSVSKGYVAADTTLAVELATISTEEAGTITRYTISKGYVADEIVINAGPDITTATAVASDLRSGMVAYGKLSDGTFGEITGTLGDAAVSVAENVVTITPGVITEENVVTIPEAVVEVTADKATVGVGYNKNELQFSLTSDANAGFTLALITEYTPYRAEMTEISSILISGLGLIGYEEDDYREGRDYSGANGVYTVMSDYHYKPANERIYYKYGSYIDSDNNEIETRFILKRYIDKYDDYGGDGWELAICPLDTEIKDAETVLVAGNYDFKVDTSAWYNDEWGEFDVTIENIARTTYPEQPLELVGLQVLSYNTLVTPREIEYGGTVAFKGFEETPQHYHIYASSFGKLIGGPIEYDFYKALTDSRGDGDDNPFPDWKVYGAKDVTGPIPVYDEAYIHIRDGAVYREEKFRYDYRKRPEGVNDDTFLYIPIADLGLGNTYTVVLMVSGDCYNNSGPYIALCDSMTIGDTKCDINSDWIGLAPWGYGSMHGESSECIRVNNGQCVDKAYKSAETASIQNDKDGIFLVAPNDVPKAPKYIAIRDLSGGSAKYAGIAVFNRCLSDKELRDVQDAMYYQDVFFDFESSPDWQQYYWAITLRTEFDDDHYIYENASSFWRKVTFDTEQSVELQENNIAFNGGYIGLLGMADALLWGIDNFQISLDITPTSDARQCICAWENDHVFSICFSYDRDRRIGVFWDGEWNCHHLSEPLELNQTYHVDIYRKDGILHCLIDGVDTGKTYDLTNVYVSPKALGQSFYFGRWGGDPGDFSARWQGGMYDIRLSDAVKSADVPKLDFDTTEGEA